MYRSLLKPLIDFFLSLFAFLILLPLILVLCLIVFYGIGSPILFKQERPGLHGKPFTIFKFRTMTNARDDNNHLLPDTQRLTTLGKVLRKTSLDELPELINVLKGDMSLVGPRPLLMQYLEHYTSEQARRHELRPGITGWAQVNGRNMITWEEKFVLDVWYVDHCSLWLDLKIIIMTIWKVLRHEGISEEGVATVTYFTGEANKDDRS